MSKSYPAVKPLSVDAYTLLADRFNAMAPTKPHNGLYERPASLRLLDAQPGQRILDAGCGPGIASEILAQQGAVVEGFDVTPRMIELAQQRCAGLPATFRVADLNKSLDWLSDATFDKVLSSLALDYIEELGPVFAEFARVTRPGGTLVFSMAHPMGDWMHKEARGNKPYYERCRYGMYWTGFGEPKPYVECYRRPMSETLNALVTSGWKLAELHEPQPLPEMREQSANIYENLSQYPVFMCIRAVREG